MPDPTPGVYDAHPIPTQCTPIAGPTESGLHRGGGSRPALVSPAIRRKLVRSRLFLANSRQI